MKLLIALVVSCLLLVSCDGIDGKSYKSESPEFLLEEYFDGEVKAWGIVQDYTGNITRKFEADIIGTRNGNKITLDETFTYYDQPETEKRIWEIEKLNDFNYIGTAGDIIGQAKGVAYGNALNWQYDMSVEVDGTSYDLFFDDWIWAMRDGVIINRSYLKKFGVTVGEVTLFMQKKS